MKNGQIYYDTEISLINTWIKTLFKNCKPSLKTQPEFTVNNLEAKPEIDDCDLDYL